MDKSRDALCSADAGQFFGAFDVDVIIIKVPEIKSSEVNIRSVNPFELATNLVIWSRPTRL